MSSKTIKVVPLRCNKCGLGLEGLSYDIVFFCRNCHQAWELLEDRLAEREAYTAELPGAVSSPIFYLPFWVFEIGSLSFDTDNQQKEAALKNCAQKFTRVYVEAYTVFLGTLYGQLSSTYTVRQVAPTCLPTQQLLGCTQASATLLPFVNDYLLAAVDKSLDVSGVEAHFDILRFYLLNMPYIQVDGELMDLYTEIKIGTRAIAEFSQLKQAYV